MTYALVMIRGKPDKLEGTQQYLEELMQNPKKEELKNTLSTEVQKVFISFGWPDFIILIHSANAELIRQSVIYIREGVKVHDDSIDTTTVICTTTKELEKKREEWVASIKEKE